MMILDNNWLKKLLPFSLALRKLFTFLFSFVECLDYLKRILVIII